MRREAPFSPLARFGLWLVFAALVMARLPLAVWQGRFLDEEGPIFFAYAWHHGAWDALWRSFGGYLNLAANGAGLMAARLVQAGYVRLEHAPHWTMGIALIFQTLPALILLCARASWLAQRWQVLAALGALLLPPMSEEVWLNVLHIQYHLVLACALLLALDTPRRVAGWVLSGFVLVLAPLCGPGALVLGPLFLARAAMERSLARLVQTGMLGLAGLVQLFGFFVASPVRGQFHSVGELAAIMLVRLGFLPFGGTHIANGVGDVAVLAYHRQSVAWWAFCVPALAYVAVLGWAAWRHRSSGAGWLLAAGLVVAVASFGGGMISTNAQEWFSTGSGERYNYLPLALFGLAMVGLVRGRWGRWAGALVLLVGLVNYVSPIRELSQGPVWAEEVAQWRADHNYALRGWPDHWLTDLSDTTRPCPPASIAHASFATPTYCESNWLALVIHGPQKRR
jgi:hypothetical protein